MKLGAITDEFSPDVETAAAAMREAGLETAELRVLWGRNVLDCSDAEVERAVRILRENKLEIGALASPLLKCTLPDAPPVDARFQQDVFASRHSFDDQERLADRAFAIARLTGARILRVFSYWRTVDPEAIFERIVHALADLAERAAEHNVVIVIENEHACNLSTARDLARVLAAVDHPRLQVVWDPANAYVAGETPFPDGYWLLPLARIAHIHAKDCRMVDDSPNWVALGDGDIDWAGQITELIRGGYAGRVNLETHWNGPGGDKLAGSIECAGRLRKLAAIA